MDKYYLVIIQTFVDETQPTAKAVYEYNTQDEACIAYYNELSYAMSGSTIKYLFAEVQDRYGNDIEKKYWERFDQPEE